MSPSSGNGRHWPSRSASAFTGSPTFTIACCGTSARHGCVTTKPRSTSRAARRPNSMPSRSWPTPADRGAPPRGGCCKLSNLAVGCRDAGGCARCCSTSPTVRVRCSSTVISCVSSARTVSPRRHGRSGPRHRSACANATPSTANGSSSSSTGGCTTIQRPGGMQTSSEISTPRSTVGRLSGFPTGRSSTGRVRPRPRSPKCSGGTGSPWPATHVGRRVRSLASTAPHSRLSGGLQSISSSDPPHKPAHRGRPLPIDYVCSHT